MTLILAHRGCTGGDGAEPLRENTLEAFLLARRLGADGVELDIRRAADGALVVHHDAEIPGIGKIANVAVSELPAWVPQLAQVLVACSGLVVDVEVKHDPDDRGRRLAADLARQLAAAGLATGTSTASRDAAAGSVLVTSFDATSLDIVAERAPGVPTGLLVPPAGEPGQGLDEAEAHGCSAVHPFVGSVERDYVDEAHRRGLAVNVWTVNHDDDLVAMVSMGVDGLITDRVPAALAAAGRPRPNGGAGVR